MSLRCISRWCVLLLTLVLVVAVSSALSEEPAADGSSLMMLTWNVLAERSEAAAATRVDALLQLIRDTKADVIALQEVTPWFIERLSKEEWLKSYHPATGDGTWTPMGGGLFIISRFPIAHAEFHPLPSEQGRGVLVAELKVPSPGKPAAFRTLRVATVHLESMLNDGAVREEQLKRTFALLGDAPYALLLGDFNFGDGEQPETRALEPTYVDVWLAMHSKDSGFTWNIEKNPMAKAGSFPNEPSRRLDRILLRSSRWEPKGVQIVGTAPIAPDKPDLFPSDHFGLVAVFTLRADKE
jgi:endonuclease/exonuclease/phosphatase family metal-dependent hydrolase